MIEEIRIRLRVKKEYVMFATEPPLADAARFVCPDDLVEKLSTLCHKNGVENQLQVVTGRLIAVQIEATRGLQHATNLSQSERHADEIREKATFLLEDCVESFEEFDGLLWKASVRVSKDLRVAIVRRSIPCPGVDERSCFCAIFRSDPVVDLVVAALGVERRIDVAEIHRLVLDVLAQNVEVVAIVEGAHVDGWYHVFHIGPKFLAVVQNRHRRSTAVDWVADPDSQQASVRRVCLCKITESTYFFCRRRGSRQC